MQSNGKHPERRKHPRLPVVEGLIEPINLRYNSVSQPAILTNLSAGGMSLILFVEPPRAKVMELDLTLPGMPHVPIQARVVRLHAKGETYNVGIQFTRIQRRHRSQINGWAEDHLDCETRLSLSLPESCVPACRFHFLCQKTQKAPHWPPRA